MYVKNYDWQHVSTFSITISNPHTCSYMQTTITDLKTEKTEHFTGQLTSV
jgi:hypothetical protein